MTDLKIYNSFGITPTNTFVSAGSDFYVPHIDGTNEKVCMQALNAFKKSYNLDDGIISDTFKEIRKHTTSYVFLKEGINILMLYYAFSSKELEAARATDLNTAFNVFFGKYLVYDANGIPGIACDLNSTLFINSGIKVCLPPNTMGVYLNKSGKGNAGFDVRAQVVDEDYTGFVHLSLAYTRDNIKNGKNIVYCGDKLTQMCIVPILHCNWNEIDEDTYNNLTRDFERGANSFGSSDVKH